MAPRSPMSVWMLLSISAHALALSAPGLAGRFTPMMTTPRLPALHMESKEMEIKEMEPKEIESKEIPYTYAEYVEYRQDDDEVAEKEEQEDLSISDDALLPSDALLTANAVAIPALVEDNLLDLPNPKDADKNAAVLWVSTIGTALLVAAAAVQYAQPGMTRLHVIRHLPLAMWIAYQSAVTAYPVMVKATLTGVTYVLGDVIAQVVQQQQQIVQLGLAPRSLRDNILRTNFWRYVRSGLAGLLFLGPLAHFYYEFVAESLSHWPTVCKIALDQTLYLSFYNTVYYLVLGWLARRPLLTVVKQYSEQFWQLLRAGWRLWPFVGVITYTIIPTAHRVLFVDLVEIAYSAILSRLTTETSTEDEPAQTTSD